MNIPNKLSTAAATFLLANPGLLVANETAAALFTSISVDNQHVHLAWSGGTPTYQLQSRPSWSQEWTNVGTPTVASSASIPASHTTAYFRVLSDFTATYEVTFHATWSQATHPAGWPNPGHWSGLVGGVHNNQVHFWRLGEPASEGIRLMAERGQQATLAAEVESAIAAGTASFVLRGSGLGASPGTVNLRFPQPMTKEFPLVTLCSMIAPSPDWFAGVDSLSLLQDGAWKEELVIPLLGHDAGTDSGATFTSPDSVTTPRGVVAQFTGFPALVNGEIVPFGSFSFRRIQ